MQTNDQHDAVLVAKAEEETTRPAADAAFDGMSSVAFKLDQLKMGEQAQRLAAFEASRAADGTQQLGK